MKEALTPILRVLDARNAYYAFDDSPDDFLLKHGITYTVMPFIRGIVDEELFYLMINDMSEFIGDDT